MKNKIKKNILIAIPLLLVAGMGIFLRLYKLLDKSLWIDETSRFFVAKFSLADILFISNSSSFSAPLHSILLHFWFYIGDSEFIIRLFPLLFGLISIAAIYFIVKKMYQPENNKRIGFYIAGLAAFCLSISPMHIHYSQDAGGPYTLYFLLILVCFYLFWNILNEYYQKSFKYFILFSLLLAVSFYLHYSTVHIILAFNLIFLLYFTYYLEHSTFKKWLAGLKKWFLCQSILLLTLIPVIPMMLHQASRGQPGPAVKITDFKNVFFSFVMGQWGTPHKTIIGTIFLAIFIYCLIIIFKRKKRGQEFKKDLLLLLCFSLPLLIGFLIGLKTNAFRPRYSFPMLAFYLILLARGIYFIRFKTIKILVIAFILIASLFSLEQYYLKNPYWEKEPWRETLSIVNEHSQANDIIIFPVVNEQLAFDYYYRHNELQLERHGLIRDLDFPRGEGLVFSFNMAPQEVIAQFESLTQNAPRIWVITARMTIGTKSPLGNGLGHTVVNHMRNNKEMYELVLHEHPGGRMHAFLYQKIK